MVLEEGDEGVRGVARYEEGVVVGKEREEGGEGGRCGEGGVGGVVD